MVLLLIMCCSFVLLAVRIGECNPYMSCMHANIQTGIITQPCTVKVKKLILSHCSPSDAVVEDDNNHFEGDGQFILLSCEFCDVRYSSRASMRAHMLKHEYVQRKLARVLGLEQHQIKSRPPSRLSSTKRMKNIANKMLPSDIKPVLPSPLKMTRGADYPCKICSNINFDKITDLSRHILEFHGHVQVLEKTGKLVVHTE